MFKNVYKSGIAGYRKQAKVGESDKKFIQILLIAE